MELSVGLRRVRGTMPDTSVAFETDAMMYGVRPMQGHGGYALYADASNSDILPRLEMKSNSYLEIGTTASNEMRQCKCAAVTIARSTRCLNELILENRMCAYGKGKKQ